MVREKVEQRATVKSIRSRALVTFVNRKSRLGPATQQTGQNISGQFQF